MKLTEITRSSIIDQVLLSGSFYGRMELMTFLKRVWDLTSMPSTDERYTDAEGDIWKHMVANDDWSYHYLLCERLNLLGCDDALFLRFLEMRVHPLAVNDNAEAAAIAEGFNAQLQEDGFLLVIDKHVSGRAIYKGIEIGARGTSSDPDAYEVVLSFAGEERGYVEEVAAYLRNHDVRCFYDRYEDVTLWGKELTEHLDKVYRSARYCVMFISKHYAEKIWTNHERKSALARAVEEKVEYILPARFDDTELPGVRKTIGYVDLRDKTPAQLGDMILNKLGRV